MNASKVFLKIQAGIERIVKGYSLSPYANEIAERVRRRTRTGYGLDVAERGAKKKKLKGLTSDKYIKYRKGRINTSLTKPKKSNLTFTGQLLNAITGKIVGKSIVIFLKENRNDGVKNSDIVKGQEDQGRHFFELSNKELNGLRNQIKKDLIKRLKRKR